MSWLLNTLLDMELTPSWPRLRFVLLLAIAMLLHAGLTP